MSVLYDVPGPRARRLSLILSIVAGLVILAGLIWMVVFLASPRVNAGGVEQPGILDPSRWDILRDLAFWRRVGVGLTATLQMAAVAGVLALVIGTLLSLARTARSAFIRVPAVVLVEFFRGMPVLLMMLFILLVFSSGAYWAGVGALALYNGAVIGEALRAGIASLPRGQRESGLAIGLTPLQVRFTIEFPQAFRQMLPIIIAQLVVLLKDTSLAFIIGYQELLNIVLRQGPTTFGSRYLFTFFFVVWAIYLAVNLTLSWIARLVARRTSAGGVAARRARRTARVLAQLGGAGMEGARLDDPPEGDSSGH
ncbi:glutamate transport system permease protein [Microbacteriaceae bacterium SG_E_30_P1]|uniref:Glutamate transport system permease protein n=1 Tax=Antiquaquibacter oligotrophicus TaxID=2880260 RepID=A0ABT6KMQ1_9MICO|nr:amino acid ABC transporter permease [Antiquaquibacter oligotrophicus]MDH6180713.1 glutamate transport system permease protein [Antiquaquibacter oligotrophicus]UDF13561.1 amino acid ABC transporter permease [Antiquaquibacter oligotrophicus]